MKQLHMKPAEWFAEWFDTPYYHVLYKDRNDADAQLFIRNIAKFLAIPKTASILDMPCGKGRHGIYLNSLGYSVTGADLSENSIRAAKRFENPSLRFVVKDMRTPLHEKYDVILNLFTSFGYFNSDFDDLRVLKNVKEGLREKGVLVLDFLNVVHAKNTLIPFETKTVDGIEFNIHREIDGGFILKHISFQDLGTDYAFTEKVKFLEAEKFQSLFNAAGLKIKHLFGDYQLSKFCRETSERLILVAS